MERMPKDSEEAEQSPRNQRSYKPIAVLSCRLCANASTLFANVPKRKLVALQ